MESVFVLWHSHPTGGDEKNEKLIGIYADKKDALEAQQRLSSVRGFSSFVQGFEIVEYGIGEDHWRDGYFTE